MIEKLDNNLLCKCNHRIMYIVLCNSRLPTCFGAFKKQVQIFAFLVASIERIKFVCHRSCFIDRKFSKIFFQEFAKPWAMWRTFINYVSEMEMKMSI